MSERIYSRIAGTGSYLPAKVVTNDDLAKVVDTSDEWIRTRTGIAERRVAAEGETTSDLGHQAALRALDADQRARLGALAWRTPPYEREKLRRDLLATAPSQRGPWLEQRERE